MATSETQTNTPPTPATASAIGIPQEAALRVVKGSLAASAATGAGGMVYGALKAQPAILYGIQTGMNTFVFAFPIFAVREYVVVPWVNEYNQRTNPGVVPSLHLHNVFASTISGGLVGGGLSAYFRGRTKLLPGFTTFGLLCAALQVTGNELRILRIKMLAKQLDDHLPNSADGRGHGKEEGMWKSPLKKTLLHDLSNVAAATAGTSVAGLEGVSSGASPSPVRPKEGETSGRGESSWAGRVWNKVTSYSPIKRVSDDEYERKLLQQRQEMTARLRDLDTQIAEEDSARPKV